MFKELLNTQRITDAIARSYYEQGDGVLREFKLRVKQRVDLVTMSDKGLITIVEINHLLRIFKVTGSGMNISRGLINFISVWRTISRSAFYRKSMGL